MKKEDSQLLPANLIEISAPGSRIRLVQFSLSDVNDIFELIDRNRTHLSENEEITSVKYSTRQSVLDSINNPPDSKKIRFAVRNEKEVLVGSVNLRHEGDVPRTAEVGYYLGAEFTGEGYMTEAVSLLTRYAFDVLNYDSLFGNVFKANQPSIGVLQRAGYIKSGNIGSMLQFSVHR